VRGNTERNEGEENGERNYLMEEQDRVQIYSESQTSIQKYF
jgi:hypothetical protein